MTIDAQGAANDDAARLLREIELILAVEALFDEAYGPDPRPRRTQSPR